MKPSFSGSSRLLPLAVLAIMLVLVCSAYGRPKFRVLHNFPSFSGDGGGLYSPLILDSAGNLYGVTQGGGTGCNGYACGGTAFELSSSGGKWTETILYNFCSEGGHQCTDGARPLGPLVFDQAGNLYGGTAAGGSNNYGVTFALSPGSNSWNYNLVYESASNGVVLDTAGNLYGIIGAGAYDNGAVAELSHGSNGWKYIELYSFTPQESSPENPLIFEKSGNSYDTTYYGGDVFELSPPPKGASGGWNFDLLHHLPSFHGDGVRPYAGLVFDASRNLYGATQNGGTYSQPWCTEGCGVVFKLTPNGHGKWKETILHRFAKFEDGLAPMGTLTVDQYGNIYGTTVGGGGGSNVCAGGCGAVFKLTLGNNGKWKYAVLHRFSGPDGAGPQAGVTLDSKGNIFGATYEGGADYYGVVFEITP